MHQTLIEKYNVPGPRYTSYPTVPHWAEEKLAQQTWITHFRKANDKAGKEGIAVYIHLPYCESLCTYCGCTTRITVNHSVEEPYIQAVLAEWQLYVDQLENQPIISELHLGGGTPTFFAPENLERLIKGIFNSAVKHEHAELSFECHPTHTTKEHLETLYKLGFRRLSMGIQDFDPEVQRAINRKQTVEEVQFVHDTAKSIGYTSVNHDLIYGLPKQTAASIRQTIAEVAKLKPERIAFYSYAHVPWKKPGQRGYSEKDLPVGSEKRQLYELGCELLKSVGYEAVGMDHFALEGDDLLTAKREGRLYRNFMGYTPRRKELMIGLGASSISDSWTGFAQNVKTVEKYRALVLSGQFPIQKGHLLTAEDLLLRKHITNIMCNYRTSWSALENVNAVLSNACERLNGMVNDGLVHVHQDGVEVTPIGEPFVRNIAMAFDPYLRREEGATARFSQTV